MLKALIIGTVRFSAYRRWLTLAVAILIAALAAIYAAKHFAINTDIDRLISQNLPWRQDEIAFQRAFPNQQSLILAVIDAPTSELAESAADALTLRLKERHDVIREAYVQGGGSFFRRNGLLLLPEPELSATLSQLSRSAPLLGPLASDPSLRGVMESINLSLRGVQFHRITLDSLAPQFRDIAQATQHVLKGQPAYFSWRKLLNAGPAAPGLHQFVSILPVLDFSALEPGAKATAAIRETAADLNLPKQGIRVRLTGPVPIADDEFETLREGAAQNGAITVVAVLVILWLALHSGRIILAVFVSVAAGLAITAASGLAMVGALNPISIAFFVLFVGIGVDFALQFSVSYRAERYMHSDLMAALLAAASNTGGRLTLAALATAAGFLSFLPTAYRGLSELGEIAGAGMIIALIMSLTVLPALLRILDPPPEPFPLGYSFLEPVDHLLERHRISIVVVTVVVVLGASPLLNWLQFDFNPMDLRNPKVESVATYLDLKKNPETAGQTAEILAPSLPQADEIANRLSALPEVSRAMTLSSFIPADQDQKLQMIKQTADGISGILNPSNIRPAPRDGEIMASIQTAATGLNTAAAQGQGEGAEAAQTLATGLSQLAKAAPQVRSELANVFIPPLTVTLNDLRQSLNPERITMANVPREIVADWLSPDGKARVSVTPKGDPNNNGVMRRFVSAVLRIEPHATGEAVGIQKAADAVIQAFAEAGFWALLSIAILLLIFLRRLTDVAVTLFPLILAGLVTLELCVVLGLKLNYANIIALPVLLGLGVAFKIYYIVAWRQGQSNLLSSPLTRAVFFSGLTTAVAFGSLWLSDHPGTSSMGQLLALSLVCTMSAAILFQPLLMGPPRKVEKPQATAVDQSLQAAEKGAE
jgi:uncharacterized protein